MSEAEQGYLGIQGVDVSDESAKMYNMPTGVYISDVVKNGGAQQAGLTKGSVITGLYHPHDNTEAVLYDILRYTHQQKDRMSHKLSKNKQKHTTKQCKKKGR